MFLQDNINFPVLGNMTFPMPEMLRVRQLFPDTSLSDVQGSLLKSLDSLGKCKTLSGKKIAVGAGSRMVTDLPMILATTIKWLLAAGAEPFIVPAMGSHGGATAKGQITMLRELGITEKSMGVPIRASMNVIQLGSLADGSPVYCDRLAAESDGIVVCQRIKSHTSFSGPIESGICKGMVVGFGKHEGARAFHSHGYDVLGEAVEAMAKVFIDSGKILFGVGIVENAFEKTMLVEAIPPENIIAREKELLTISKANLPHLQFDQIDVLIIDRIGKDINGCGCDPNVTGRPIVQLPPKNNLKLQNIVALDLTPASHGNACGVGVTDFITRRLLEKISLADTYTNIITSGATMAARLPIIANDDEQAIRLAIHCAYRKRIEDVRVVHITDTLHITEIDVSASMRKDIENPERFTLLGPGRPLKFDDEHALI